MPLHLFRQALVLRGLEADGDCVAAAVGAAVWGDVYDSAGDATQKYLAAVALRARDYADSPGLLAALVPLRIAVEEFPV